jgi:hypothetical protein
MTRSVRPTSPDSDVVKGREGRPVEQEGEAHIASGPAGETRPSRPGRIYAGICSDSCVIQDPLDVAGGSIYDNASDMDFQLPLLLSIMYFMGCKN